MRSSIVAIILIMSATSRAPADSPPVKRLIEFGWDEPDTSLLLTYREQIVRSPFDGCVFHVDSRGPDGKPTGSLTWHAWGTRAFTDDELQRARADLERYGNSPRKSVANFLRFNTTPAKLDWFDDHSAVIANARSAARLARIGSARGILLDTEQYEGMLFDYGKQRDAKTKSFDEYATKARQRGREIMSSFQSEFPGLHVLVTFGHSLPLRETKGLTVPLSKTPNGLLAPFLDGMLDAAEGESRIIDGYELSYGYRDRMSFERGRESMRTGVPPIVGNRDRYEKYGRVGFGLWLDYDWRVKGWNAREPEKNYFSPSVFERSVKDALDVADEYVWIYTEQPRWWTPGGVPEKLPPDYLESLRRAKGTVTPRKSE